ncbi:MAG: hypothetical protein MJ174_04325 [Treponema sp.]|nr:hypothetical protein [Treponema sp.]
MKKNKILFASIVAAQLLTSISCGSTEPIQEDNYSSTQSTIIVPREAGNSSETNKNTNFWGKLFGTDKFIELDDMSICTQNMLFKVDRQDGVIIVQTKSKTVGFGSQYNGAYYYVTFDDNSRLLLNDAVNKYLSDFEEKKLDRKNSKSYKIYGSVKCRLDWGTFKISTPNNANATAYLGYKFDGKSPYFTITIYSAKNNMCDGPQSSYPMESMNLNYYLTKAMATDLVNKISNENINDYLNKNLMNELETDEY